MKSKRLRPLIGVSACLKDNGRSWVHSVGDKYVQAAIRAVGGLPVIIPAFGGEFDPNKPVLLKGKVIKLEWVNPHAWIHVEIPKADGAVACQFTPNAKCDEWMVEGGTPNTLLRRGITRDSLKTGTELVIDGKYVGGRIRAVRPGNSLPSNGRLSNPRPRAAPGQSEW